MVRSQMGLDRSFDSAAFLSYNFIAIVSGRIHHL